VWLRRPCAPVYRRPRPIGSFSEEGLADRIAHVRRAAGDRFPDIELSVLVQAAGIVSDPGTTVSALRSVSSGVMTAEQVLRGPFVQLGRSSDEVVDRVAALSEHHGVTYITVFDGRSDGFDRVVTRLANG
jgi:hypothetical protein